jgi:tRNA-specific 2-thiouridylase
VVDISPGDRRVVVGTEDELYATEVALEQINWLGTPLAPGDTCEVQVRYRAPAVPARIKTGDAGALTLDLLQPARAVTPGQSGVLYAGDRLLGGGIIAG